MKKQVILLLGIVFSLTYACKEETKQETSQMKMVLAIHDEVMPKTSEIGPLVAQLRKRVDSDTGTAEEKKAMEDLQDAHNNMMEWMRGFGDKFDHDEIMNGKELSAEKQALLDIEEKEVKIVKEKINSSIANAKKILNTVKN